MMHMLSIDQMNFNAASFQDLEQRDPIHTRGLHRYRVDPASLQPVDEGVQVLSKCRKRSHRFGIAVGGYRNDRLGRPHIDTTGISSHHRQSSLQLSMLPLPWLRHRSPPIHEIGNEPGVHEMENLSSGIIATGTAVARHQCYGARAWDQTPSRARKKHHWGYDLRLPLPVALLYNTLSWRKYKVPYCYGAGQQDSSGYSFAKEG